MTLLSYVKKRGGRYNLRVVCTATLQHCNRHTKYSMSA